MKKLLKEYGISEKELRRLLSSRSRKPKILKRAMTDRVFKFGIVSDTHLSSKEEKLNELLTFYHICKKEGVKIVLHSGDIVSGQGIYRGQEQDIHTFGVMNQSRYAIAHYPSIQGITTYFITGNHDLIYWKQNGVDIGELLSRERKDLIYLGQWQADIEIGEIIVRLSHPGGGLPYALTYRAQKIAEHISSGKKPRILILGHLHTSYYFFYRNMHIIGAGAFEGQTPFLMRKGINPTIGGWIIKVRIANDKKKSVVAITPTFIPFFE